MSTADTPANVSQVSSLRGTSGFQQLVAQSRLSTVEEGTESYTMAANAVREIRANAQLRKDEWKSLDENLVRVARDEMNIVNDLRAAGLTVSEDLSTLIREYEKVDEFGAADVDMEPETAASEDTFNFSIDGVPLPIVHKSFHVPYRKLLASRERGEALDVTGQEAAARKVGEKLEDMALNGWASTVGGYQVYGFTNHPDRTTSNGSDWDDFTGVSADDVRGDIVTMIEGLEDNNYRPGNTGYYCYVDRASYQALRRRDTGTDQERGLLERLNEEFDELAFIKPNDYLDSGEGIMFAPRRDVVELAVAADLQNVEWMTNAGFRTHMKVMASITPIVKSDSSSQSGVYHMSSLLS